MKRLTNMIVDLEEAMKKRLGRLLIVCICIVGCACVAYHHMNVPARDSWQKPKAVVEKLNIKPGSKVADLGAGGGYFTWYLASAVGPEGKVYAVDIDETGLDIIKKEITA